MDVQHGAGACGLHVELQYFIEILSGDAGD